MQREEEAVFAVTPIHEEDGEPTPTTGTSAPEGGEESKKEALCWEIDFGSKKTKKHKASRRELKALQLNREQAEVRKQLGATTPTSEGSTTPVAEGEEGTSTNAERISAQKKDATTPGESSRGSPAPGAMVVDLNSCIDMELAVPRKLTTTAEDMQARNHFNTARWQCMVRQYKASCGISSLTCVWNYLYSRLGCGTLPPVSQEEIMTIIGFQPPFETVRWGPFTGNVTLMRWFHAVNKHFGVKGKAYYQYKAHGQGRTIGLTPEKAKEELKETLRSPHQAVVYHCYNHYMVPIGFQESPRAQIDCYAKDLSPNDSETFIVIGEVSRGKHPPMHIKKWADLSTDIECQSPYYFNIRHSEEGVKKRAGTKKPGGNLHCLIGFRSDMEEENLAQFEEEIDPEEDDIDSGDEHPQLQPPAQPSPSTPPA